MYTRPSGTQTLRGKRTHDNPDIECYRCHQKGHISSDPKCPQHPSKQGRPRFNAQRLVEDDEPLDTALEDMADQIDDQVDQNSWGGSQYDPPDELDKVEDTTQEPTNDPALEDDAGDEVHMSSMRTVQMGTMCIVPEGEQQVRFQAMRTVFLSN